MHYAVVLFELLILDGQDGYIGKFNTLRLLDHASVALFRGTLPCLDLTRLALPCLALPCLALPCLDLPCLALPCLALPRLALPCLALPFVRLKAPFRKVMFPSSISI